LLFGRQGIPVRERATSKASQSQETSVLSENKHGLIYLTANDWALIVDKAIRRKFRAGEHLVQRDRPSHGVFVLLSGTAAVQIPSLGKPREIGPGEICGEISFLDDLPATADVVANSAAEVLFLDRATLQSLFELFPHLGSRFFHSLAAILSRRLRELINQNQQRSDSQKARA
jgi:CRP-like cAMP-binding protein